MPTSTCVTCGAHWESPIVVVRGTGPECADCVRKGAVAPARPAKADDPSATARPEPAADAKKDATKDERRAALVGGFVTMALGVGMIVAGIVCTGATLFTGVGIVFTGLILVGLINVIRGFIKVAINL